MLLLILALSPFAYAENGEPRQEERNKFKEELDRYSSYHRGTSHYEDVKSILDQIRRTSARGAPEAMQRGPSPKFNGAVDDETELSKNSDISNDLFEGDIVLTVDQAKQILENAKSHPAERGKRKVVRDMSEHWPGNIVYYTFDKTLDDIKIRIINSAIKAWEDSTCVKFQQGIGQGDYLTFMDGMGCYGHVGRNGGQQGISIGDGCEAVGIAAHEIGHALGFWHEQNRYDRSDYVKIEYDRIYPMALGNFMRIPREMMNDYGIAYDLGSVMHYGSKAFSSNQKLISIRTLDPNYQSTIGQRQRLSFIDVKQINMAYCSNVCKNQLSCFHDGYPDPAGIGGKCDRCRCPLGFGGKLCDTVDESDTGCGGVINANSRWQSIRVTSPTQRCSWILKAPSNSHVQLNVTNVNLRCREVCSSFLEIKKGPNFAQTGYRFCCPDGWINPIISAGNEISLVYRGESAGNWAVEFKFRTDIPQSPPARIVSDGAWTAWTQWTQCSASCGGCGLKTRRRDCIGGACGGGQTIDQRSCGEAICPAGVSLVIDSMCRHTDVVPCKGRGPCGTKTTYYMCAKSSPYFVRPLTADERKKKILSGEWNQPRSSDTSPCCSGFQRQADICIRIGST